SEPLTPEIHPEVAMFRPVRQLFARVLAPRRPARPVRRAADLRAKPLLQALEGRVVPATFTVTNTANSGAGSLRQAILDANAASGPDTVIFSLPSGPQIISLQTALPTIFDPLTVLGPGAANLTVRRDPALPTTTPFRVFT